MHDPGVAARVIQPHQVKRRQFETCAKLPEGGERVGVIRESVRGESREVLFETRPEAGDGIGGRSPLDVTSE